MGQTQSETESAGVRRGVRPRRVSRRDWPHPDVSRGRGISRLQGRTEAREAIESLLAGEGYAQNFFSYWADILRAQTIAPGGPVTSTGYLSYIRESLRANSPYDQFVRGMIGAQGRAWDHGGIGYYMRDRGMPLDNFAAASSPERESSAPSATIIRSINGRRCSFTK